MLGVIGSKLEMFARVLVFGRAHPSTDPGYALVLNRFEGRLNSAEVFATRHFDGQISARKARLRRKEVRDVVHFQVLPYLIRVGGAASKLSSELADRFSLPDTHAGHRAFLTSVRSMLAVAESQKDAMVSEGMSPKLLEDLARAVAELDTVSNAARAAGLEHVGARADLKEVTAELMELVLMLDGINRWRFGKDPDLLVEWNAAKHLPPRTRRVRPPSTGEGVPAA